MGIMKYSTYLTGLCKFNAFYITKRQLE